MREKKEKLVEDLIGAVIEICVFIAMFMSYRKGDVPALIAWGFVYIGEVIGNVVHRHSDN